jgi:hypothetical protein
VAGLLCAASRRWMTRSSAAFRKHVVMRDLDARSRGGNALDRKPI